MDEGSKEDIEAFAAATASIRTWMRPGMVMVDVETTGLDPARHGLIEFALLAWDGASLVCSFRPRPGCEIDTAALEVNGATKRGLDAREQAYYEAIDELYGFLVTLERRAGERLTLCGMNVHFDAGMLGAAWDDAYPSRRFPWSHRYYDLHSVALQYLTLIGRDGGKLYSDAICQALGIEPEPKPHQAWQGVHWSCRAFARIHSHLRAMHDSLERSKQGSTATCAP
jgi:hypothetical protein